MNENQFGFRPSRSTEVALVNFTRDILTSFDEGMHAAQCAQKAQKWKKLITPYILMADI